MMFVQVVFGSKEDYYFLEKEERERSVSYPVLVLKLPWISVNEKKQVGIIFTI